VEVQATVATVAQQTTRAQSTAANDVEPQEECIFAPALCTIFDKARTDSSE